VDPVPDSLLLRKYGSAGNRTQDLWISSQKLWPLDHRGSLLLIHILVNLGGLRNHDFADYARHKLEKLWIANLLTLRYYTICIKRCFYLEVLWERLSPKADTGMPVQHTFHRRFYSSSSLQRFANVFNDKISTYKMMYCMTIVLETERRIQRKHASYTLILRVERNLSSLYPQWFVLLSFFCSSQSINQFILVELHLHKTVPTQLQVFCGTA
jgi:hypothetical protein